MSRVAITGMAVSSPFGADLGDFWRGLLAGPAPVATLANRGIAELDVKYVPLAWNDPGGAMPARVRAAMVDTIRRALADAGHPRLPEGGGLVLGSHFAETDWLERPLPTARPAQLLAEVARELGATGPVLNTPVGCAAGNLALAWGLDCIRRGEAPLVVAGGFDLIGPGTGGVFEAMGNLTRLPARPFDDARDGVMLGEGGAYFVLEPLEAARARGATVLAELAGAGSAHDADSPVRPALDGRGLVSALRAALADAGVEAKDVGYVNAHAPGTRANDPGESAAYVTTFGPRGVPISSTKAALGHAQGGANALEAAACVLALRHGVLPPTVGVTPDEALGLDVVHGAPRAARLSLAVSTASAMGGGNVVIVLRASR